MKNSDANKSQYVDVSYGWQEREESTRRRERRRRQRWLILAGVIAFAALAYLVWRLS